MMTLDQVVGDKRIIICGGSGGVGKTTLSAALGYHLAAQGKRAVVITIDPARRLADALGIAIAPGSMVQVATPGPGTLHAVMLEPDRAVDSFMQKLLGHSDQSNPIVSERFFQHGMAMLAASPEYLALQELHDLSQREGVDVIVLDTPPTRQSIDFLTAPARLAKALQEKSVVVKLAKPYLRINKVGFSLIKASAKPILNIIDKVFGIQTFIEFFSFFEACVELLDLDSLESRIHRVDAMLRDEHTTFLVVAAPNPVSIEEALYFHGKIANFKIAFGGFVINRVQPDFPPPPDPFEPELPAVLEDAGPLLLRNLHDHQKLRDAEQEEISRLAAVLSPTHCLTQVPRLEQDVHDLAGISAVAAQITTQEVSL